MWSVWQKHLIICLFLGLLIIPVYFLDKTAMEGDGGNWITFDFRGFIVWTYIALLAVDIPLSSIAVLLFPNSSLLRIHFASIVLSIILLFIGFMLYGQLLRTESISGRAANFREEVADLSLDAHSTKSGAAPRPFGDLFFGSRPTG